jgi:hypothetical protein
MMSLSTRTDLRKGRSEESVRQVVYLLLHYHLLEEVSLMHSLFALLCQGGHVGESWSNKGLLLATTDTAR